MPASVKNDIHNVFLVTPQAAVDLANHTAVASVDTDIAVQTLDGADLYPLRSTDYVTLVEGFGALEAGISVVNCKVKSGTTNTITLRTTNASAGAINPASIAAAGIIFAVYRR